MITKRLFVGIWLMSIIGSLAKLPYIYFLGLIPESISLAMLIFQSIINSAILFGVICWFSYILLQKVDLNPFDDSSSSLKIIQSGILPGIFVGLTIIASCKLFFPNSLLNTGPVIPLWAAALASLYGSINEEILCRLFLITFLYFILNKIIKNHIRYKSYLMWGAIFTATLLFGIGHLPAAFQLIAPSSFEIFRILLLNGIAGVVFGWLYCSRGFWTAVMAHFIADLVVHVFVRLF